MNVLRKINKETDKGKYVVAIFLDLQKTFDTVDHRKVLTFLEEMEVCQAANLSQRKIQ